MIDHPYYTSAEQYYDKFSIGITTTEGRQWYAYNLYGMLSRLWPTIPISIIYNKPKAVEDVTLPAEWNTSKNVNLLITDELISFSKCQNLHALAFPERPYVIWFGDTDVITSAFTIDSLILMHTFWNVDVARGYNSTGMSMFKKALAEVSWWDERYYFKCMDVDFAERLRRIGITEKGFTQGAIMLHVSHSINHYPTESLEGFANKDNGVEFHRQKWGQDCTPHIPIDRAANYPEVDWYPEYTEKFKQFKRLKEE